MRSILSIALLEKGNYVVALHFYNSNSSLNGQFPYQGPTVLNIL